MSRKASKNRREKLLIGFVVLVLAICACDDDPPKGTPVPVATPTPVPTAVPTATSVIPEAAGEEIREATSGIGGWFKKAADWDVDITANEDE